MGGFEITNLDSQFLEYSTILETTLDKQSNEIAAGISERLGPIFHANQVLIACLGSIHSRNDREFDDVDVVQKVHRAAIHAAVVQGMSLVTTAISRANYVQAATLVRQEIEAFEATRGLRQGLQKEGQTPRLKALRHIGRSYGHFSSLAHLSKSSYLIEITDILSSGIDPSLNTKFERNIFCIHLVAIVGICLDAAELRPYSEYEMMSPQEVLWLQSVCGLLAEEGFLSVETDE